jgi:hypothetical protein
MEKPALLLIVVLVLAVSCRPAPTSTPVPTPLPPTPPPPPQGGPPQGPVHTPLEHAVYGATSKDGVIFTDFPEPFFKEASVPDVVEITVNGSKVAPKGTLVLYFLDFSRMRRGDASDAVMVTSTDGRSWSPKTRLVFRGLDHPEIVADPSVVELPDGKLRLYFFYPGAPGTPITGPNEFWSAISEDGVNFQVEPGVRLRGPGATDPEVVKAGDEWLMIYAMPGGPHLARSRDGLEWMPDERAKLPTSSVLMPDGKIRAFKSREKGAWAAIYEMDPSAPDFGKG